MKENLLLLNDLLEPERIEFINAWLQYQKHVYIGKLVDVVNKYNNGYRSTIKMKPVDVKWNTYISSSKETTEKIADFKISDTVRISKCKNIFAKGLFAKSLQIDLRIG